MNIENKIYKNLHVRIFSPERKIEKVIIAVHGFAGDKDSSVIYAIAKEMTNHSCAIVTFDLPNHGENETCESLSLKTCFNAFSSIFLSITKATLSLESIFNP